MAFVGPEGLQIKTVEDILGEIAADLRADVDATLDTSADSVTGQISGVFASQLREAWEALEVAYNGSNPDAAEDFLLDALAAITGTVRRPATKSTVTSTLNLNDGTTVPAGSVAHVVGKPSMRFATIAAVTNSSGVPANFSVAMESEELGPVVANAGTLTVIATPVTGWNSVTNPLDAVLGRVEDTNAILRARREQELRQPGGSTVDSIRSDLLALDGMESVSILENVTELVDANGLLPHSIEAVIFDGDTPAVANDVIAQRLWDSHAAGIGTNGTTTGNAVDGVGDAHTMRFSRPVARSVWIEIDLDVNNDYPADGDTRVKAALLAAAASIQEDGTLLQAPGKDVIALEYRCAPLTIVGVRDVTAIRLGFAPSPVGTANLVIAVREHAKLDTSRITVNS